MAKKIEEEKEREKAIKNTLIVWASPVWSLKREGTEIKFISGCGFFPEERDGLVKLQITVEEI